MSKLLKTWEGVDRAGIESLVKWLEGSDYLMAPCSRNKHLCRIGGLAEHSWNVFTALLNKVTQYGMSQQIPKDSIIICGLGHDLCKVDYYKVDDRPASDKQVFKLKGLIAPSLYEKFESQGLSIGWASKLIDHYLKHTFGDGTLPPQKEGSFKIEDAFPLGHGEKSAFLLSKYIDLTEAEALAIRWHMGPWDQGYGSAYQDAVAKHPLVTLLHTADLEATHITEREEKKDA